MIQQLRQLSRTAQGKLVIGLAVATVAVAVPTIKAALAASSTPAPPQPVIQSGPTGPTTSSSATFTYTDSQAGVTFKCSLDGADFKTCSSKGITYTGLTSSSHTFRVAAQAGGSPLSSAASRTWTVDRIPPAVTIAFPTIGGAYRASTWNAGCPTTPGICGTASDPSSVQGVSLSIRQASTGKYWNGAGFTSTAQVFNPATGTTSWRYGLALPANGSYTVAVRVADGLGNLTPTNRTTNAAFTIDTVVPPAPVLTKAPDDPTFDTDPHFALTDAEPNVAFECSLDGGAAAGCSGNDVAYKDLATTDHCFEARAVDRAGNTSAPVSYCWTILIKKTFEITGAVPQPFFPGATRPVDVVISNPFNFDIRVESISIDVVGVTRDGEPNPACDGSQNLVTAQAFNGSVLVPKNETRSLSSLSVPFSQWPVLEMPDLPFNQDACKSSSFELGYTGTATKS